MCDDYGDQVYVKAWNLCINKKMFLFFYHFESVEMWVYEKSKKEKKKKQMNTIQLARLVQQLKTGRANRRDGLSKNEDNS